MSEDSLFQIDKTYANRRGKYKVLAINEPMMTVQYEDGVVADVNVNIQFRIWENIRFDMETRKPIRKKKVGTDKVQHIIKTVSISAEEDLSIPGLKQRIAAAPLTAKLSVGDRLVYYAIESAVFFAVATITSKPKKGSAKDYGFEGTPKAKIFIYPIDVDSHIINVPDALHIDSVGFDSLENAREELAAPNQFFAIGEDDFVILDDAITELAEEMTALVPDIIPEEEPLEEDD